MSVVATSAQPSSATPLRSRWVLWVLVGILLFTLGTDLIFFTGFFASDDLQYTRGAIQLATDSRMTYLTLGTIRLGIVLPLALVARVTNQSISAMAAFMLVFHLLVVLGTYWLGKLLDGVMTGLLAAGFMAVCPLAALFATMVLPDHAATGFMLLSASALLVGLRRAETTERANQAYWTVLGAGVLFGVSMTAKEVVLIVLPVFGVMVVASARKVSARRAALLAAAFLAGVAVVACVYLLTFRAATGVWSPLHVSSIAQRVSRQPERVAVKPYHASADRLDRLVSFGRSDSYLGVFRWAVPFVLVGYPFLRRRSWLIHLGFIWLCAYMTWGTFSLHRYSPPPVQIRYFILPLPFLLVMAAQMVAALLRGLARRTGNGRAARALRTGLAVAVCLVIIANSYSRLNRLAGKGYFAREVSATRYALDFAKSSGMPPVVLSNWISMRVAPSMGKAPADVVRTDASTGIDGIAAAMRDGRFVYAHAEREAGAQRGGQGTWSPLDEMIQGLDPAEGTQFSVYTLGTFSQFSTRLAGLRYLYNGTGSAGGANRLGNRGVVLREVTLVPEDLSEDEGIELDLSRPEVWAPTWAYLVDACELTAHPDGSLECRILGSDDASAGQYGGVRIHAGEVRAIQMEVTFTEPEQIAQVFVDLTAGTNPRARLRWQSTSEYAASLTDSARTLTFAFDRPTPGFSYMGGDVAMGDVDHVQFFVKLRGLRARAGFRIHRVIVWPRSDGALH